MELAAPTLRDPADSGRLVECQQVAPGCQPLVERGDGVQQVRSTAGRPALAGRLRVHLG